jgi:hypothetical protein
MTGSGKRHIELATTVVKASLWVILLIRTSLIINNSHLIFPSGFNGRFSGFDMEICYGKSELLASNDP